MCLSERACVEGAAARRVGASVGERTRICERFSRTNILSVSSSIFFHFTPSGKRLYAFGGPSTDFTISIMLQLIRNRGC